MIFTSNLVNNIKVGGSMQNEIYQSNAKKITHAIISNIDPEELAFFEVFATQYFENPNISAQLEKENEREGADGIQLTDDSVIMTILIMIIIKPIVSGITKSIEDVTKESVKKLLKPHIDKLIKNLNLWEKENISGQTVEKLKKFFKKIKSE